MTDHWTDRLSEYLDGTLSAHERAQLEAHLADCRECRMIADDLQAVTARASTLADRPPARDLWSGIADRIGVGTLPVPIRSGRRRIETVPQLLAAGIAIALMSTAMLFVLQGPPAGSAPPPPEPAVVTAVPSSTTMESYDRAAADLAQVLAAGRDRLDPRTVRILERNLRVIDGALREAQQAVADDPASRYLQNHLAQTMQRKLEVLRHAAQLVAASS